MDYDTLQERKWGKPFRPFRLVMRDGRGFDVTHPNLIWPGRVTILVGVPRDPTRPDQCGSWVSITLTHIDHIEPLDQQP